MKRFWSKPRGCRLYHLFTGRQMSQCGRWDRFTVTDKFALAHPCCAKCWSSIAELAEDGTGRDGSGLMKANQDAHKK